MQLPTLLRLKPWTPPFSELHEYAIDLQRISMLREKLQDTNQTEEYQRYGQIIEVMQEVILRLNTPPKK